MNGRSLGNSMDEFLSGRNRNPLFQAAQTSYRYRGELGIYRDYLFPKAAPHHCPALDQRNGAFEVFDEIAVPTMDDKRSLLRHFLAAMA
jgi:hypothetical protein